jgi:diguanylate cyclase (GGDEF)-like protein
MRIELGVVLVTTLVLFYGVTYRSTRSRYAGLWCLALLAVAAGTLAYLGTDTSLMAWTTPLGSALTVLGSALIWQAARTLDGASGDPWLPTVAATVAVPVASFADDPGTDAWAGSSVLFPLVTCFIAAAAVAMWSDRPGHVGSLRRAIACSGGVVAAFYLGRFVTFVVFGPGDPRFDDLFGTTMTTIVMTFLLVGATFSMTAFSYEQLNADLRLRASSDPLTGLLNRSSFVERARLLRRDADRRGATCVLVMADVDHFKSVNDTHGHGAGDGVLVAFADACRSRVRAIDLVARYGGEEFVIMLAGATPESTRATLEAVNARLHALVEERGLPEVTVSYGVAETQADVALSWTLAEADRALYVAKAEGRDRIVMAGRRP